MVLRSVELDDVIVTDFSVDFDDVGVTDFAELSDPVGISGEEPEMPAIQISHS